jgi:hypothetical protein
METTWLVATVGLPFLRCGPLRAGGVRLSVFLASDRAVGHVLTLVSALAAVAVTGRADR